jgi:tetratricopeptide (TPR) repeat protein
VSEESERIGSGTEGNGAGVDPTAVALALAGASRERADAFLKDQQALIAAQLHHLHEQLKQIHLDVWEKRLGVMLRAATMAVGLAVAGALASFVWDAHESNNLLIEPFSVPPDLESRGMTGQVVASKLLDRLVVMQAQTGSARIPKSFANNWSQQDLKIDIPETGLSIAELDNFLRDALGHDSHIAGEIVHTGSGLALTARAGAQGAETVEGADTDLDAQINSLAEGVYRLTQPYRYAVYLAAKRDPESMRQAVNLYRELIRTGSPDDRIWAYNGLGIVESFLGDYQAAFDALSDGIAREPRLHAQYGNRSSAERFLAGHDESALADLHAERQNLEKYGHLFVAPAAVPPLLRNSLASEAGLLGDYATAADGQISWNRAHLRTMTDQSLRHEPVAAVLALGRRIANGRALPGILAEDDQMAVALHAFTMGAWADVTRFYEAAASSNSGTVGDHLVLTMIGAPKAAIAHAHLGQFAQAHRLIDTLPADCYRCVDARGVIASLEGDRVKADRLFAEAVRLAPSPPFAYTDWAQSRIARGDLAGAIALLQTANGKSPHYADALELWGEALMTKNQSHLAVAKFADAAKYAPNWGRLHLKWGEALVYAGKKDEAEKQLATAARLDLTPSEKAELARAGHV